MKKSRVWSCSQSFSHSRSNIAACVSKKKTLQGIVERSDYLLLGDALKTLEPDEVGFRCRCEALCQIGLPSSRRSFDQNWLLHSGREPDNLHEDWSVA
jgi:hypothetical protein